VRARGERGQAAVELVLCLPLIALLALALLQVAVVARDQVAVTHAAREAAREAAVTPQAGAARQAALAGSRRLAPDRLEVDVGRRGGPGDRVEVRVVYEAPTDVPLIGPLLGDVRMGAKAAMRVER
jgi:Flp pilus assembly protein TadG